MAKMTTQVGGVSLGRGYAVMAGLAMAMVLSRILSPSDYGTYRQVWLLFYSLAPMLELGIVPNVTYFLPQLSPRGAKSYLILNGILLLLSGGVMAVAFLGGAEALARLFNNPSLVAPLRAFSLFPVFALPYRLTEEALLARGRGGAAGMVAAASATAQTLIVLGIILGGGTLDQAFHWLAVWAAVRWSICLSSLLSLTRGCAIQWEWAPLRQQLAFALPVGAAAGVGLLATQLDRLVVSSFFTTEDFAIYVNGAYQIPLVAVLTLSVSAVLIPALFRAYSADDVGELRRLWHGAARRLAWLFFPSAVFLFVAAGPLMVLIFSDRYAGSAGPFRIFLFDLPLRIALHGALLRAVGRTRPILTASLSALVISLALALTLVHVEGIGILGPAIASVVASYVAVLYAIRVSLRLLGWRWCDYLPWKTLSAIMGVALISAAPTLAIARALAPASPIVRLAAMAAAYTLTYLVLGKTTGAAPPREWLSAVTDLLRQR